MEQIMGNIKIKVSKVVALTMLKVLRKRVSQLSRGNNVERIDCEIVIQELEYQLGIVRESEIQLEFDN
jgi:hypothetical protein